MSSKSNYNFLHKSIINACFFKKKLGIENMKKPNDWRRGKMWKTMG